MLESSDKYIKLCKDLILELEPSIPVGHDLYKVFDELRQDFKTINANSPDMVKLSCIHIKLCELKKKLIPAVKYITEIVEVEKYRDCGDLEQQNANLLQIIDNLKRELDEFKKESSYLLSNSNSLTTDQNNKIIELLGDINALTITLENLLVEHDKLKTTNNLDKTAIENLNIEIEELNKKYKNIKTELVNVTATNANLLQKIKDLESNLSKNTQELNGNLSQLQNLTDNQQKKIVELEKKILILTNNLEELRGELLESNNTDSYEIKIYVKEVESLNNLISELNKKLLESESGVVNLDLIIESLNKELAINIKKNIELNNYIKQYYEPLEQEITKLRQRAEILSRDNDNLIKKVNDFSKLEDDYNIQTGHMVNDNKLLNMAYAEITDLNTQIGILKQQIQDNINPEELNQLTVKYNELKNQNDKLIKEYEAKITELNVKDTLISDLQNNIAKLSEDNKKLLDGLQRNSSSKNRYKEQIKVFIEELDTLTDERDHLESEIKFYNAAEKLNYEKNEELRIKFENLFRDLTSLKDSISILRDENKELDLKNKDLTSQVEVLEVKLLNQSKKIKELTAETTKKNTEIASSLNAGNDKKFQDLEQLYLEKSKEYENIIYKNELLQTELTQIKDTYDENILQNSTLNYTIVELEENNKNLNEKLNELKKNIDRLNTQIEQVNSSHKNEIIKLQTIISDLKTGKNKTDAVNKLIDEYKKIIGIDEISILRLYLKYRDIFTDSTKISQGDILKRHYNGNRPMSNKLRLTNISDRKPNINNRNDLIDSLNSILEHIQSQITVLLTIKKPEGNNIRSAKFRTLKDNFFDELTVYLVNTNYYEYKDISDNNIKYDKVYELLIKSFETIN